MALPAAPPFWGSRSRALERQIVRQREQEARLRRQWELHSLSFRQAGLRSRKQAEWSSRRSFQQSMEAHGRERLKAEKAAGLERRRRQLRELLFREREGLAAELRALRPGGGAGLEEQRRRGEELRSAREERRKQVAEERLYECWKNSSAKLREVSSELHKKHLVEAWGDQLAHKQQLEAADREEKLRSENRYERARQEALERLKQEEKRRKQEEEKQAEFLLQQMEALQLREVEATKLKEEEENLLKQRWELQALKAERKLEDERRRKVELGCFLKHQYHAQLRRRAQQVQEELKDRRILLALSEKDNEDQRLQSVRQEEAMATAAWMRAVVEQQLQLEREREAELETVFREEAKQVWERREEEWESERKARDRLMAEVLAERAQQIQEKVEQNRQAQQESVMLREQLIQELEEAKRLTQQEQEEVAEQKTARKQELQAQLTERQLREEEERQHQRDVAAEAQLQAQHNERLEALEARRMAEAGYHSQSQGRPKSAWT
ncbi:trichoplein keratin filament-binding protein isoform X2 [Candoia aspera]|uniref:trichoplein keratin filament-binding protein isoform X2 n=1 Tax=Candoia aspera TaxID=51853 RepID=UPI002FD85E08